MAITRPEKVPPSRISSIDIVSADAGLDQRGRESLRSNSFSKGYNVGINGQGQATTRYVTKRWLPNIVGTAYQVFPVLKSDGKVRYLVADAGKIKWAEEGSTAWTNCTGDSVTTTGVVNTFLRVLNKVFIMNGTDALGYVDISDWSVKHYTALASPSNKPTLAGTGLTGSNFKIYYSITFNGVVGTTANSPIETLNISKTREQWDSATQGVTITRNNTAPSGATSWNVYISTSASGGTISNDDMLPLALGLDLANATFFDNGTLAINLSAGTAPNTNGTAGPRAKYGVEIGGRPFLYGAPDKPYSLFIGGNGPDADKFNPDVGGAELIMNDGTNFAPMSVVGFRNGQGIPGLTVLFTSIEGLSKQAIIESNTVTYGSSSFVVWGYTEQNYGSAGVSSPSGVVNYKGALRFPTMDGFVRMDTKASLQNVLSTERITDAIVGEVNTIKPNLLQNIVGTAWDNKVLWTIPARMSDTNNEIIVADTTKTDSDAWQVWNIACQWIGVVSPQSQPAFLYVCRGNQILKLVEGEYARDEDSSGAFTPVPTDYETAMVGSNTAHNGFFAIVQTVFYLLDTFGDFELHVNYRDYRSGEMRTVSKAVSIDVASSLRGDGWGNLNTQFAPHLPLPVYSWGDTLPVGTESSVMGQSLRIRLPLRNAITNEVSGRVSTAGGQSNITVKAISFEVKHLGINPDVRN